MIVVTPTTSIKRIYTIVKRVMLKIGVYRYVEIGKTVNVV